MKKIGIVGGIILVTLLGIYVVGSVYINKSYVFENKEKVKEHQPLDNLSMMIETSSGSGEYQESKESGWPSDGYIFNSTLSKCENGGELSWDNTNKQVLFSGNKNDKCYVYFDKVPNTTLADYVKAKYTGTQGENNLYLHDSTLTNGAGDGSYRYAGSSDTTNNFVCFGYDSTDGTCPTDYLYRIIGVFGDQVKLIKYDYAKASLLGKDGDYVKTYPSGTYNGTNKGQNSFADIGVYNWNIKSGIVNNTWSNSLLNKTNLNTNYINNIGTNWSNKIATHTWKVGGNTDANLYVVTVSNTYKNEITNPVTNRTYDAKVGLMYVSDYGYAAAPSAWTTIVSSYNSSSITSVNWMYMGLLEWTITPSTSQTTTVAYIYANGGVSTFGAANDYAVRPVLYLESSVAYVGGNGTASSPFLIK